MTLLYNVPDFTDVIKRWDFLLREVLPDDTCLYAPAHHFGVVNKASPKTNLDKNRENALGRRMKALFTRAQ